MKKHFLKLRRLIEDADFSQKELAARVDMGESTLNLRLGAPESAGAWRWYEIVAICQLLNIPQEKIGEYFFPEVKKGGDTTT